MVILIKARNCKSSISLPANLIFQDVTEFQGLPALNQFPALLFRQAVEVRIWQRMSHLKHPFLRKAVVEEIDQGVDETRQQYSSAPQYSKRFPPNRADIGNKEVGTGMKDQIEALIVEA